MKHLWNFLALWAGTVLTVFIAYEVLEAIKAIVASASKAFGIATDWRTIVSCMIISIVVASIMAIVARKNER